MAGTAGFPIPSGLDSVALFNPAVSVVSRWCVLVTLNAGNLFNVALEALGFIYLARIAVTFNP